LRKEGIILIGIGNTLRTDDGVGAYVVDKIESSRSFSCKCLLLQQLSTDLIPSLLSFENILIVDAGVGINTVTWKRVTDQYNGSTPSTHHIDISQFVSLAQTLYNVTLSITVCTIPVYDLSIGEGLSSQTSSLAEDAILQIKNWLTSINT
jgi:hydrogenase maturation protease